MTIHFQHQLLELRKRILHMGAAVDEALARALRALLQRDEPLARAVIEGDARIDELEVEVEEETLKIMALNAPVADDLRFLVAVLKMNNDLERIADHAVNIAKRAAWLARHEPQDWPAELEPMGECVCRMVRQAFDALVERDAGRAREVCAMDDQVDASKRALIAALRERLLMGAGDPSCLLKMLDVPRHLERIADLATNIAEDVVYLVEGHIIRHQRREPDESHPPQAAE